VKKSDQKVDILLGVQNPNNVKDSTYRAYAEVWGVDSLGKELAVCWVAGLVNVENVEEHLALVLELDVKWVLRAGALGSFKLKNVVIQDIQVYVPVAQAKEIPVIASEGTFPIVFGPMNIEITKEMRQGAFPKELEEKYAMNKSAAAPTLVLVHGYCTDVNPWIKFKQDFTDAAFFLEPSASLTNQQFSNLVMKSVEGLGMTSFGGIGHSQGGLVLAHILNYYFSGLDKSTGNRRIQSLGTPFKGNSGAGSAANLIKIFGYGCGENFDLTTDGSSLWLVGIAPDTRNEVFYYTTTYEQGNFFGDYCSIAVNMILKWPNDGVCEEAHSDLKGGTDLGNKQYWCHTTDMRYTAQYYDHERNKQMNSQASR